MQLSSHRRKGRSRCWKSSWASQRTNRPKRCRKGHEVRRWFRSVVDRSSLEMFMPCCNELRMLLRYCRTVRICRACHQGHKYDRGGCLIVIQIGLSCRKQMEPVTIPSPISHHLEPFSDYPCLHSNEFLTSSNALQVSEIAVSGTGRFLAHPMLLYTSCEVSCQVPLGH